MKKHLMRALTANIFSKFIKTTVVVLMLTGALGAKSQVIPAPAVFNNGNEPGKAEISYVASSSESLFFDVKVDNATGNRMAIIVKDDEGTIIYRGIFYDKNFKKRFIVPKTGSDKIKFEVKTESGNTTESFEINSNTRVVEEVVVKRIV